MHRAGLLEITRMVSRSDSSKKGQDGEVVGHASLVCPGIFYLLVTFVSVAIMLGV